MDKNLTASLARFGRRWRMGANNTKPGREGFATAKPQSMPQGLVAPEDQELSFEEIIPQLPGGQRFQEGGGEGIGNALGSLLAGFAGKGAKDVGNSEIPVAMTDRPPEAMHEATHIAEEPATDTTPTFLPKEKRPSDALYAEIERRQGKDFKGKDRDTDHNILDVLRSAGLGALKSLASADPRQGWEGMLGAAVGGAGAGGVGGAIDPNTDERMGNQMNLAKLLPQYEQQYGMEQQRDKDELQRQQMQANITGAIERPRIARQESERKAAQDARNFEIKERTLNWKKEDRDRYFELENDKLAARERGDEQKAKQFERKQAEIERNNRAVVESREKIAGMREGGQDRRSALQRQMQEKLAQMRTDAQQGRQEAAIQAQKELKAMEQEYKALTP